MEARMLIVSALFISLLIGWILPSAEGISLAAFLLLRQQAIANSRQNGQSRPSWGEWGQWSMCTSTSDMGVRARSRPCNGASCERLRGDNYEVEMCNQRAVETQNQKSEYLQICNEDPAMMNTLSCRLYRENPTMAYDIYQSTGGSQCGKDAKVIEGQMCLFEVIGDQNENDQSNDDLVFGRPPDTRAGEIGLTFQGEFDTAPLSSGRFDEDGVNPSNQRDPATNFVAYSATNEYCKRTCETIVVTASTAGLGSNAPSTLKDILMLLATDTRFRDNSGVINGVYGSCLAQCRILGPTYAVLRMDLLSRGQDSSQSNNDLILGLVLDEDTSAGRKRRSAPEERENATLVSRDLIISPEEARLYLMGAVEEGKPAMEADEATHDGKVFDDILSPSRSPQREKGPDSQIVAQLDEETPDKSDPKVNRSPKSSPGAILDAKSTAATNSSSELSRKRRQARLPNQYRTPCFMRNQLSSNPSVLNIDDTEGELFFYEGNQQQFLRRLCVGFPIVARELYQAQEAVTQVRTNARAVCKQGFLRRYGLLIMLDPEGEFSFSDGEKFAVRLRPFKLESHCALSVLN